MNLYTIHDQSTNLHSAPLAIPSKRDAIESFQYLVNNDEKSLYFKYPADFTLYEIASFDQETGTLETHPPISIKNGAALKIPRSQD